MCASVLVREKLIEFIRTAAESSRAIASGCGSLGSSWLLSVGLAITKTGDLTWHGPQHYCQYLCSLPAAKQFTEQCRRRPATAGFNLVIIIIYRRNWIHSARNSSHVSISHENLLKFRRKIQKNQFEVPGKCHCEC